MKILDIPRSGSYAGVVSSHNRAGQYVRNRRAPVQPIGTGRRANVRAAFAAAASGYGGLTNAQQDAWTAFANMHPVTDSLGQSIILTGQQMYVRVTASLANVLVAASPTPPTDLVLPDLSGAVVTFNHATNMQVSGFTGPAGSFVAIAVSQPVSPGRRFWKTFWQPFGANGFSDGAASPYILNIVDYTPQFGVPPVGSRVFVRLTPMSTEGWNGPAAIISAIVT